MSVLSAGKGSVTAVASPYAAGGTIPPTSGGTVVRVAEAGRAETIVDTETLRSAMAQRNSPAAAPNMNVYVQNPWTGEYLLAKTQAVAVGVYGQESAKVRRQIDRATR